MNTQEMDEHLATLKEHAQEWARLHIREKIAMGRRLMERTRDVAARQVAAAADAKSIPSDTPAIGEEWLGGPLITIRTLRLTLDSLEQVAQGRSPALKQGAVRQRPSGQVVVDVFPHSKWDELLYKDFTAQVWMDPDLHIEDLSKSMAVFYKKEDPMGKVSLVLGAGNVASIGPLDVIYKLYAEGQVCMLKMNPVNAYLGPFIEEAFREFIDRGFLRLAYGGGDVGAYLCQHEHIEEIHITGSDKTHDAIVYGVGEEGAARKKRDEPIHNKRITSELGNVSPVIIVPGKWSTADLNFHAENIATQLANNGGFNCNAARVIITHAQWPQREAFLDALRDAYRRIPQRVPYYPGARDRFATWVEANRDHVEEYGVTNERLLPWAFIPNLPPHEENLCYSQESFCGVQAETAIDADGVPDFLKKATDFANDEVWGTLNAALIIHPNTAKKYAQSLDKTIENLRFGSVVINHWPALSYGLGVTTWGAYPGHTYQDIRSGMGVVHNSFLFDRPQKSVIHGPFRMFPKPPWFVTNKQSHEIAKRLVDFELKPNVKNLGRVLWYAVRA